MKYCACVFLIATLAACAAGGEIILNASDLPDAASAFVFAGDDYVVKGVSSPGTFRFPDLLAGTFNLEIVAPGVDLIGVDLRPRDASDKPLEVASVAPDVEKTVRDIFEHTSDFFNRRRMPLLSGGADRVVALVENSRSGDETTLSDARKMVIFRLDLWDFRKSFGSWRKEGERPFLRRLVPRREFEATTYLYSAQLGGVDLAEDQTLSLEFRFPKWQPQKGEAPK